MSKNINDLYKQSGWTEKKDLAEIMTRNRMGCIKKSRTIQDDIYDQVKQIIFSYMHVSDGLCQKCWPYRKEQFFVVVFFSSFLPSSSCTVMTLVCFVSVLFGLVIFYYRPVLWLLCSVTVQFYFCFVFPTLTLFNIVV